MPALRWWPAGLLNSLFCSAGWSYWCISGCSTYSVECWRLDLQQSQFWGTRIKVHMPWQALPTVNNCTTIFQLYALVLGNWNLVFQQQIVLFLLFSCDLYRFVTIVNKIEVFRLNLMLLWNDLKIAQAIAQAPFIFFQCGMKWCGSLWIVSLFCFARCHIPCVN